MFIYSLSLVNNGLQRIPSRALSSLLNLESLSLKLNKIRFVNRTSLRQLTNLRLLDLSANLLSKIHLTSLHGLVHLQVLNLADNNLRTLPKGIFETLSQLRIVDLSNNDLHHLHGFTFSRLTNLQHLSLSFNPNLRDASLFVRHINSSLSTLEIANTPINITDFIGRHKIKTLVSSNRPPTELKYIAKILGLEKLDLQNNGKQLDSNRFLKLNETFKAIKYLDLSFNSELRKIESILPFFPGLTHLYLEKVRLKRLRSNFSQSIRNLTHLVVKNCQLEKIHRLSFEGLEKTLQELQLSHNWLKVVLPDTFDQLARLKHVDLSFNRFQDNNWEHVPHYPLNQPLFKASSKSITHLSLASNYLQYIPIIMVRHLSNLTYLNMAGNNLSSIQFINHNLRQSVPYLSNLKSLNLNNNRIKQIQAQAFTGLINLEELSLSYNLLQNLTGIVFPLTLQYLRLKDNQLKTLDGSYVQQGNLKLLSNLKLIDLNDNKLENISVTAFQGSQRTLIYLDISGNMLNCSCSMKPFIEWLGKYGVVLSQWTMCFSPDKLRDHMLIHRICWSTCNTTNLDNLYCPPHG